jgi:hypothetical protein
MPPERIVDRSRAQTTEGLPLNRRIGPDAASMIWCVFKRQI